VNPKTSPSAMVLMLQSNFIASSLRRHTPSIFIVDCANDLKG
jgi:hypothetical protein